MEGKPVIRRLDESTICRIAAGEVIERPASVVKELVENSLDAGSKSIVVRIEAGGMKLIEVSDDGCGIPAEELPVAVERHATSKITTADDLERVSTMGFRGEALATIAVAGRLTIISRAANSDGARWTEGEIVPAARDCGTTILVRDLFAKTPARLKFMKSESTESSRVSDILERIALARPEVSIELIRDGKSIFRTSGRGDLRQGVAEIFGADLAKSMLELSHGQIEGLIGPPQTTRKNRTGFYYNLAGRPIDDKTISHAIVQGYEGVLPGGEFPIVFLTIRVDPVDVDVNVHPAKAEVRFHDSQKIHRFVSQALRQRLRGNVELPTFGAPVTTAPAREPVLFSVRAFEEAPIPMQQATLSELITREIHLDYAGAIAGRYVLAEDGDGLVVIDQHAAHERVMFDRLMSAAQNGEVVEHPMLVPATIEMAASDRAIVEESLGLFREIGFELELWPDSVAVKSVPAMLAGRDASRIIREIIDAIKSGGEASALKVPYARLAMEACKSAVKGTQRLAPEEARELLNDLASTTDPYNCPHGRPTMVRMTLGELDRRFGRS